MKSRDYRLSRDSENETHDMDFTEFYSKVLLVMKEQPTQFVQAMIFVPRPHNL